MAQDRNKLYWYLRGIPEGYDHVGVRVDSVAAVTAAQYGFRDNGVVSERCPGVKFLSKATAATRALKLAVELFLGLVLRSKLIVIAFK